MFWKREVPEVLPQGMQAAADALSRSAGKEECLRKAYGLLTAKYHGGRVKTVTRLLDFFARGVELLWEKSGFMHCTNSNYLLYVLLLKSGWFADDDIASRWTLIWYVSPHQYVRVRLDEGQWVTVDLWARVYGIPLGDYAHGFHAYGPAERGSKG